MAQIGTIARFEVSGEILNEDVLALLAIRDAGVPGADMDKAEEGDFYAAWDLLRDQWQSIRSEVADFDTERLRRRWIIPLLELLGHKPEFLRSHPTLPSGASVPITHRTDTIPIWLADFAERPDDRPAEGKRRRSKHELFQEFLDMTEDDWGILCTGRTIRLLTDYHKTLTRNFVEADLESIFDELDLDAFRIVWRLFRASAFVPKAKGVRDIERIRDHARQQGTEIGKELRKQVVEAVVTLANGFLEADETGELRQAVESESEGPMRLYQSVLRVVYRLLFLLYVENKPGWTPAQDPRWASGYSISRLRAMAEDPGSFRAEGEDLWEGLKVTFRIIREGCTLFNEPISPYGGELFDDERLWLLKDSPLANAPLLRALYLLTIFERREKKIATLHRVNFRNLQIDALGSVYESLLEERPILDAEGRFGFYHRAGKGNKRKETGSYYTPPELVAELIKTALLPVIEDRLMGKTTQAEQREAILGISVVDPACGSGAFLIQALDALAEALLKVQLGDEQPSELQLREARRDVAIHCIHGVDMNPMAVELCKFTIWLHVAHPKFPLSYLEPLIRSGNSLVGVPTKAQIEEAKRMIAEERQTLLQQGKPNDAKKCVYVGWEGFDLEPSKLTKVPDEAFAPVGDDDTKYAKSVQERNKSERAGQLRLTEGQAEDFTQGRLAVYRHMQEIQELDPEAIREKTRRFDQYLKSGAYRLPKRFADAWCAAFFWPLKNPLSASGEGAGGGVEPPTHAEVAKLHPAKQRATQPTALDAKLVAEIERRAEALQFFHWELEFPDVFEKGGFDVVLGNPPYLFLSGKGSPSAQMRSEGRHAEADHFDRFATFATNLYPYASEGCRDLFKWFVARSLSLVKYAGRTALVVPSSWISLPRYADIRRLTGRFGLAEIVELGFEAFPEVTVATSYFVCSHDSSVCWYANIGEELATSHDSVDWRKHIGALRVELATSSSGFSVYRHELGLRFYESSIEPTLGDYVSITEGDHSVTTDEVHGPYWPIVADWELRRFKAVRIVQLPQHEGFAPDSTLHSGARCIVRKTGDSILCGKVADEGLGVTHQNAYVVKPIQDWFSVDAIVGLLNSRMLSFLYRAGRLGQKGRTMAQLRVIGLRGIPMPPMSVMKEAVEPLAAVGRLLQDDDSPSSFAMLNNFVYQIYGVTPEERAEIDRYCADVYCEASEADHGLSDRNLLSFGLNVPESSGQVQPTSSSPQQAAPIVAPVQVGSISVHDDDKENEDEPFELVAPEPKPPTPLKDKQGNIIRVRVLGASGHEIVAAGTVVGSKKQGQAVEWAVLVDETNAVRKFLSPPATLKRIQGLSHEH